jgi:hypothetical protein
VSVYVPNPAISDILWQVQSTEQFSQNKKLEKKKSKKKKPNLNA